jgi:uncharacterized protein YrzB (UPF0473 family)
MKNNENNIDSITLRDENGNEIEFEVITKLEIEDKEYLIVAPKDEKLDAVALRIDKDENGEDILSSVDDDDEFNMVSEAYNILFSE